MSAQDEVSIVVKCLQLGAADYLVKPLRMNELLNLWTHMWRRRRMVVLDMSFLDFYYLRRVCNCILFYQLGLTEKDVFSHDLEISLSDPSDVNTSSTILISDNTDDQLDVVANPELNLSNHPECEVRSLRSLLLVRN